MASVLGAALLAGVPFAARPADPFLADPPAFQHGIDRAEGALLAADERLAAALAAVRAAIDATRRASISASTDEQLDEGRFTVAGEEIRAAADPITAAAVAVDAARASLGPFAVPLTSLATDAGRTTATAGQVEAAQVSAAAFIALRTNARHVLEALGRAAAALGRDDPTAAAAAADEGATALELVRPASQTLPELRLWLETTGDLLATVREAVTAMRDGDPVAAAEAQRRLADAADEAAVSDRALALAVSESAGRVLGTPLQQLASQARALGDAQAAVATARAAVVALGARHGAPLSP